ncbi:hypothetical protein ABI59_09500 [Acidobacteria bacterium Mor1]|nr:hypothetical protein ABI59_09500 [Acidobacteria bacterium Mor1]
MSDASKSRALLFGLLTGIGVGAAAAYWAVTRRKTAPQSPYARFGAPRRPTKRVYKDMSRRLDRMRDAGL